MYLSQCKKIKAKSDPYSIATVKPGIHLGWDSAMEHKTQEACRWNRNCGTGSVFENSKAQVHISEGSAGNVHIQYEMGVAVETNRNVSLLSFIILALDIIFLCKNKYARAGGSR